MGDGGDHSAEDARLARLVALGGDPDAEAALCKRLFPRVRAYGRLHLRDDDGAIDLTQHVLVVVIEALRSGKVREIDRFAAFVSGTCRNTVLDWKKGDRRRRAVLERFGPSLASVVEPAPGGGGKKLEACLRHLAERERCILALTFYAELSVDEIGQELAMTAGHVRVARHRALEQLHDCLGGAE
jgi:RNA polymerase sigma-70 factor (ECF subfamily)